MEEPTLPPAPPALDSAPPTLPGETLAGGEPGEVAGWAVPSVPGYEVLGELGRGGMGVVFKARQVSLDRTVALKMVLHAEYASADARRRFHGEAKAIARLSHPNIVQVHEVAEHRGLPYCALEFCPGGSLADRLRQGHLGPRDAAALVRTLARAVHAAHEAKIVHRDLKPANVLLTGDGTPKVADFGLAKRQDASGGTGSGSVLGTPAYMAPEQARGENRAVGPAVDVYALGAVLYECLTGRPPFSGPTAIDTILQLLERPPSPIRPARPEVSAGLEAVCLRCLEKDPARRYASAAALADDLDRFLAGGAVAARPGGPERRRRRGLAVGLAVVVLLAGLVMWLRWRQGAARDNGEQAEAAPASRAAKGGGAPRLFGLLVGVSDYSQTGAPGPDGRYNNLLFPARDALALQKALKLQEANGYPAVHLTVLTDRQVSRTTVLEHLRSVARRVRPQDRFVLALFGHGDVERRGPASFHFVCPDYDPRKPGTILSARDLVGGLARIECYRCVLAGACRAGALARSGPFRDLRSSGKLAFLAACEADEASVEPGDDVDEDLKGNGLFARCLTEALTNRFHLADRNKDGLLDPTELGQYVRERTPALLKRLDLPPTAVNPVALVGSSARWFLARQSHQETEDGVLEKGRDR